MPSESSMVVKEPHLFSSRTCKRMCGGRTLTVRQVVGQDKANFRSPLAVLASVCLHIVFNTSQRHYRGTLKVVASAAPSAIHLITNDKLWHRRNVHSAVSTLQQVFLRFTAIGVRDILRMLKSAANPAFMAGDQRDDFHIKTGRSRSRGTSVTRRSPPFVRQVEIAVRKAGGNPNRIDHGSAAAGGRKGERSGRFNARGRGAKVVASFPKDGGGWQRDSAGWFRSRRVVVKARVVKLNPQRGSRGPKMPGKVSNAAGAQPKPSAQQFPPRWTGERPKMSQFEFPQWVLGWTAPDGIDCARMRSLQISNKGDRPWNRLAELAWIHRNIFSSFMG